MRTTQVHSVQMKWATCKVFAIKFIIYFHQYFSGVQFNAVTETDKWNFECHAKQSSAKGTQPFSQICTAYGIFFLNSQIWETMNEKFAAFYSSEQNRHTHSYIVAIDNIIYIIIIVIIIFRKFYSNAYVRYFGSLMI